MVVRWNGGGGDVIGWWCWGGGGRVVVSGGGARRSENLQVKGLLGQPSPLSWICLFLIFVISPPPSATGN